MGLSLLLCAKGKHSWMIPHLLASARCPRIHLREDAQLGTVWIPDPLDCGPIPRLLLGPARSCSVLPGSLQVPNSSEAISEAAPEPLGARTETVIYRKSGNTRQAAEVPRAMQSNKEVDLFSSVKCRNPIPRAS